jgi:riboflavin synthase
MFTGIVEGTGEVLRTTDTADGRRLRIGHDFERLARGQSISVSGVCLTVEAFSEEWFEVFLADETVARTYLGAVEAGEALNVERALPADGRLDGHIVQGHVDGTATVAAVESVGEDWRFEFDLPADLARYVVEKGSIAIDGISLTVAARPSAGRGDADRANDGGRTDGGRNDDGRTDSGRTDGGSGGPDRASAADRTIDDRDGSERVAVAIIPTTYDLTTLSEKSVGDPVHVEVDVVAKYVERLVEGYR